MLCSQSTLCLYSNFFIQLRSSEWFTEQQHVQKKNQQPSKHTPYKTCQEANAETLKLVLYLLSFWFWLGSVSSAVAEGVAIVSFREVIL